jgi:hypothetical protein
VPATIELVAPGRASKTAGTGPRIVVEGEPGEHLLFASGRQGAARVQIAGDDDLGRQLRTASLGI